MRNSIVKRILCLAVIVTGCVSIFCGCSDKNILENNGSETSSSLKKQKVTLITKSTNSAFWGSVYSGASAASTEYNMELLFQGPDNEEDYETQNRMIREAVKDGTDAIVISAIDYEANSGEIDAAAKEGVKIVVIDSDVHSENVSCRIGTDNYEAGCMAGEAALACKEETLNIGIVNFDETTENGQSRERGFRDTVEQDDRVVIRECINVRSSVEAAKEDTKEMLLDDPQINLVVTFNEWTSLGVGYAIKEMRAADEIMVVAFDSNVVSVDMLETGEVDALVVQNPYAMGYLGVENAYNLLNGSVLESEEVDTLTKLVTRENMYTDECQRMLFAFDKKY